MLIVLHVRVNIPGAFLCSFWGTYEHSGPFATWIKETYTGKAVLGQRGGDVVLGTELGFDGV